MVEGLRATRIGSVESSPSIGEYLTSSLLCFEFRPSTLPIELLPLETLIV